MSPRPFFVALALAAAAARAAPAAYTLDPAHTYPSFEADHMGISVWRGKMDKSHGTVVVDRAAGTGQVDVTVELASIDFGLPQLDAWARGNEFFDVEHHPTAHYVGTLADFGPQGPQRVKGTLTLHGVTRPVDLVVRHFKCIPHPLLKRELCGADLTGSFQRDEFGLDAGKAYGFNMAVDLRIQAEAIADEAPKGPVSSQ
jgi:polyisoprenoid-binding protein YceI